MSQSHALLSIIVLNTVHVHKYVIYLKKTHSERCFFKSSFDRDHPFSRFPPHSITA